MLIMIIKNIKIKIENNKTEFLFLDLIPRSNYKSCSFVLNECWISKDLILREYRKYEY